ncbi:cation-translocating P-type ATPase [Halorubrum sp. GN11_10-6_MGM]|uniref:heavy metal translocating P-type ATPase n=1 Tax=Halorubrum sp. GN11_10-6_MGM TaxID=2518112 RepID=UPI0010F61D23|nr:heavy metal translocating P-type ATPase [Halorubrum sp. GN11_10-6_MGM]TKX73743.1 cation-translocating P-type ATPase [Halorubrum sp. GN11_10-6_MGM]
MDRSNATAECGCCGRSIRGEPVRGERGTAFCSSGCRDIRRTLGPAAEGGADSASEPGGSPRAASPAAPDGRVETFFRIDGMHSPTCEEYLESVADSVSGVSDAEASYVTETVRVAHDPEAVSAGELRESLSRTGYTAFLRDDAADSETGSAEARRSREMSGSRKRRSDEVLGLRYAAGIVFGAFLLVPYVSVMYPTHLAPYLDLAFLDAFEGAFRLTGASGFLFLRVYFVLTAVILFFTGMPVLRGAYVGLKMRRPTTDVLVAVTAVSAFAYGTGAVLLGDNDIFYDLTLVVAAVATGVAFFEASVKRGALDRLTELTVSQASEARRLDADGEPRQVSVGMLAPGDRILVRAGERIPVDGTLVGDDCTVKEAVVTGEALPVPKRTGDEVVGGAVVSGGAAVVEVSDPVTSSVDRITDSLWSIQSADHGIRRRADRLASRVAWALAALAVTVGVGAFAVGRSGPEAAMTALLGLLVATPWALGVATPLSVATSIRDAMERGVVVLDDTIFERLREVDVVVFDKTGTLTTGEMDVVSTDAPDGALAAAAALERRAAHPAAAAVVSAVDGVDGRADATQPDVREFRTHAKGVSGTVDGREVLVGSLGLFVDEGWRVAADVESAAREARGFGRLPVVVGRDGRAEGLVVVGDEPREGWAETVASLRERGVEVVVLTGDDPEATDFFAEQEAVAHVFAGVPPEGKTAAIRRLQRDHRVAMVGDGTNDAPALAAADLGISLGSGTALAADAADIAIVDDDLSLVETTFDLAAAARRRVGQNLGLALVYNGIAVPVALVGLFNPLTAMGAVVVCGGLVGLNASRPLLGD